MRKRFRIFWNVVKRCHLDKAIIGFLILFFLGSLMIMLREPDVNTYPDALWVMFVSCMTIGYGDYSITTHLGRILVVITTIYQLVIFAMITGVIIGHYQEVVEYRQKAIVHNFLDKMKHLTELSKEELEEIQEKAWKIDS